MTQQPDPTGALTAECDEVDAMLAGLDDEQWQLPTPAPGWTIAHQVAHLAATFKVAGLAGSDADAFRALMARLSQDFTANVANALGEYLSDPPKVLFDRWQAERHTAVKSLSSVPGDQLVPWLVNPLPPSVLMMAGMMEAFAHGQDIADALGVRRSVPTASGSWWPSPSGSGTSATWPATSPAGGGVRLRADRALRCGLAVRAGRRARSGSAARPRTSACWSPGAGTATTSRSPPSVTMPSAG